MPSNSEAVRPRSKPSASSDGRIFPCRTQGRSDGLVQVPSGQSKHVPAKKARLSGHASSKASNRASNSQRASFNKARPCFSLCPASAQSARSDEPSRNPINTPPHRTRKAGTPNNVRTGRTGGTSRRTAPRRDNGGYTLRQEVKRKRKSALQAVFRSGCSVSSGIGDGRTVKGQIWQKRIVPANDSILSKNGMTVPVRKTDPAEITQ